ncbi:MAG: hypothetical protein ACREMJ_12105 [Gemmatimonadales bacterium]
MARTPSKGTAVIERLLEERRQYEAWIVRLDAAADATQAHVRTRVRADYVARLKAVTEELVGHAEQARQLIAQKKTQLAELAKQEKAAAERLQETELRHAVGEYDESQWSQVHKDALAELMSVREDLKGVESDIAKLEELDRLVRHKPGAGARAGSPARQPSHDRQKAPVDELAFLKSVTEDEGTGPSPRRASGAQFQPAVPDAERTGPGGGSSLTPVPRDDDPDAEAEKTLKCSECGTMNLATEWYCEQCGAELAAL